MCEFLAPPPQQILHEQQTYRRLHTEFVSPNTHTAIVSREEISMQALKVKSSPPPVLVALRCISLCQDAYGYSNSLRGLATLVNLGLQIFNSFLDMSTQKYFNQYGLCMSRNTCSLFGLSIPVLQSCRARRYSSDPVTCHCEKEIHS